MGCDHAARIPFLMAWSRYLSVHSRHVATSETIIRFLKKAALPHKPHSGVTGLGLTTRKSMQLEPEGQRRILDASRLRPSGARCLRRAKPESRSNRIGASEHPQGPRHLRSFQV